MTEKLNPALGIARVAIGRPEGLREFGRTVPSFLSSLAPLLAFPLAGALIELVRVGPVVALATVAISLILQLTPAVLSHAFAVWWKREEQWLHYATAFNWCFWALPVALALLTLVFGIAIGAGLPDWLGANGVLGALGLYSFWLHWFLARHGLELSRWRAGLLVVAVNLAALLLVIVPGQLG